MKGESIRIVFFGEVNSPFGVPHFFEFLDTAGCDVVGLVLAPQRPGDLNAIPVPDRWGNPATRDLAGAARERSIPIWRPDKLDDPSLTAAIGERNADLIASAGFRSIIPTSLLGCARLASVNFHPSLLPRMRGSNPWFWTLIRDERETAATVHHMVATLDAGDIIFQSRFKVEDDDTLSSLLRKSILESLRLVRPLVDGLRNGTLPRTPQTEHEATTFREPADADYRIDWRTAARDIHRLIRASCSAPGALTSFHDLQLRITRAEIATDPTLDAIHATPGDIVKITPAAIVVRTGEGHLVLRTVRHEDRDVAASAIVGPPNQAPGLRFE